MLLKILTSPLWLVLDMLIGFFPLNVLKYGLDSQFLELMSYGIRVVGFDNFAMLMGSFLYWTGLQYAWALIEWIYKKIPGVS